MSKAVRTGKWFVQGDEAIAEGAIAAGCRYYAGYPITPASEISEAVGRRMPEVGGVVIQMEDELASIHSVGGASVAGLKALTVSSGPGISLKLEGLGWGIKNEIPYVVVDVQRAGPSNGVATRVGQGDLYTVKYGSAGGNNSIIALSPQSTQEAFDLTIECFNLAEIFRTPVFLLTDETVGHTRELLVIPDESELKIVPRFKPTVAPEQFHMYPMDTPGAIEHPFPNIGEGYGICVSPYTHTSKGYATTSERDQDRMAIRLTKKVSDHLDILTRVETHYLDDEAEWGVVAYGGNARPALAAVNMAREAGIKCAMLRPIIIWPFPDEEVYRMACRVKNILVPELNRDGQLSREVARAARGQAEVCHLGSGGVEPHLPSVVLSEIQRMTQ
ncbi:MAG: 2-oxoacid:acceptor oxidoreductase subunit alpha [Deltaproteobacteria bacterium]|nr:2-oxoacid:acceptor oxidoreductase subunit alpha [Deltaproteobacteria bacterium]MBW2305933.1 2-oxoacid:acceptor oxidoreductase subunit alpha [Deltaproteobacteria bacterium]